MTPELIKAAREQATLAFTEAWWAERAHTQTDKYRCIAWYWLPGHGRPFLTLHGAPL